MPVAAAGAPLPRSRNAVRTAPRIAVTVALRAFRGLRFMSGDTSEKISAFAVGIGHYNSMRNILMAVVTYSRISVVIRH